MNRVSLQFNNEQDLQTFYDLCKVPKAKLNVHDLTILCYCEDREIELAINGFEAKVVRREIVYN